MRLYRDLVSLLPRHLSIRILSFLSSQDLIIGAKVVNQSFFAHPLAFLDLFNPVDSVLPPVIHSKYERDGMSEKAISRHTNTVLYTGLPFQQQKCCYQ